MENQSKVHPVIYVERDLLDIQRELKMEFFKLDLSHLTPEGETQYMQNLLNQKVAKYFNNLEMLRNKGIVRPISFSPEGMIESYTMDGIHKKFLQA